MTITERSILACVDGSVYTDSICDHAAWASRRLAAPINLLHLIAPASDYGAPADLSGAIGLGAKSALLEKLTQVDEARGKLDQQKGNLILEHSVERLSDAGIENVKTLHRRGSLVETVMELESTSQLLILGKRGENADFATLHLGSNLERVVRAAHQPVLVVSRAFREVNRFVIAYDGGPSTLKAVDYVIETPLFQGLECHLIRVGSDNQKNRKSLAEASDRLTHHGFDVQSRLLQGNVEELLADYVKSNAMGLLIMGAYGHSHIRTLIIGSTTSNMLRSCPIPVLMFR